MPNTDHHRILGALVGDDPELARLAQTSAAFRHGLEQIAATATVALIGLVAEAERIDADTDARIREAKRNPFGEIPLTADEAARATVAAPLAAATRRGVQFDMVRRAALNDGHGDVGRCRSIVLETNGVVGARCTRPEDHEGVHAHADRMGFTWRSEREDGRA